ncbi:hypothetical protein KIMH_07870 [Bombiscardovia apis]|uniref:Uncharacterized protein n=1 Tax=Bombiscardovia apis TaxID=2932182 RepID=A0ABN6SHC7_9BIFI|nr:hypothetical protein [Bombiscardovia apis]BDR54676.1 hypothetical protein KIMH_07870 [Bombiscardovia apis]
MFTSRNKKFAGVVLALVTSLGFAAPAMANNHADTSWSFTLTPWNNLGKTGARSKTDTSSVYARVNWRSNTGPVWAWAEAGNSANVGTAVVPIWSGQSVKISQYIYEWGYRSARLCISDANGDSATVRVTGVWSPDSV